MSTHWILYGANGGAGQFIATHAVALGLQPYLAGRSDAPVAAIAEKLGLDHAIVTVDDPAGLDELLADATLLVNCAGPFDATAEPLVEACLRTHTHYIDLCSEPLVLDALLARDEAATRAGVLIVPGVGFSVIPSDCLVRRLHALVPKGDRLEIAIAAPTRVTVGSVASIQHALALGPLVRREGRLVRLARPGSRTIVFGRRSIPCLTVPSAELIAAASATEIPDITVFVQALEHQGELLADYERIAALLHASLEIVEGDGIDPGAGLRSSVWARLTSHAGERVEATLDLPDPLAFTATAVCDLVCHLLEGELPEASGATTLGGLLGPDFVLNLPGVGGFGLRRHLRA